MQITVAVNGSAKNTNKKQRNTKHETTKNIADQWPHEVEQQRKTQIEKTAIKSNI